jgi:hypothetical protein
MNMAWNPSSSGVHHKGARMHAALNATPSQFVFVRDAMLTIPIEADWALIRQRKHKLMTKINQKEEKIDVSTCVALEIRSC